MLASFQGGWENDETVQQAAVREALEEAGVRGDLVVKKSINLLIICLCIVSMLIFFTIVLTLVET